MLRIIRPYAVAQRALDRDLAAAVTANHGEIEALREKASAGTRMPPFVADALNRQSERLKRLESDLRADLARISERMDDHGKP